MNGFLGLARERSGVWAVLWLTALVAAQAQQSTDFLARAVAPDPTLRQLSLGDAQHLAFEKNWDLLAAAAGVDAATAQKIVARQFPNPTVSQYTRSEEHTSE